MLFNIAFFSFIAGFSMIFGVYLVRHFESWVRKNIIFLVSFAIGVLLSAAFFNLLPKSAKLSPDSWFYWTLGAIIFLYLIEQFVIIHSCQEEKCEVHTLGTISIIGLGFHSLIDGIIIAAGFEANYALGLLVFTAVIFHKIAAGTFTYGLLIQDKMAKNKALLYSWLVALATPVGAILTFLFIQDISSEILGWLLAIAAGSFIYLGASDLIPETHKKYNPLNIFLVLSGIAFVFIIGRLVN